MSCGWFDLKCHAKGLLTGWLGELTAWVDGIFPFGWYGVWFIAGVIVGERFGKWAYAGIATFILYRIFGRDRPADDTVETDDIWPHPDKPRKVTAPKKPRPLGKRRYDPSLNEWVEK